MKCETRGSSSACKDFYDYSKPGFRGRRVKKFSNHSLISRFSEFSAQREKRTADRSCKKVVFISVAF